MARLSIIESSEHTVAIFLGLNNGNGRGSFDHIWYESLLGDL